MSLSLLLDGPRGLARGVWGEGFAPAELVLIGWFLRWRGLLAKDCHDVFDRYDIELVIGLKIHGDSVFGVKDNFVVLSKGHVLVVFDLARDRNDSAGDRWDFGCIGQGDSPFGLPFGLVLKDQDSGSDGFNGFEGVFLGHNGFKGVLLRIHRGTNLSYYGVKPGSHRRVSWKLGIFWTCNSG